MILTRGKPGALAAQRTDPARFPEPTPGPRNDRADYPGAR